ncbi:MAG: DUF3299 domain-containing protein [Leptothrix sp. (in: b-proteobacteria)]
MKRSKWAVTAAMVSGTWLLAGAIAVKPVTAWAASKATSEFKEIKWGELIPADWDPSKQFKHVNPATLNDGSPETDKILKAIREAWDNAPTRTDLEEAKIKLPGYLVPLEESKGQWKEFLLVPYFGACIHSPPPPANQIIHVFLAKPVGGFKSMDAAWVSGTLKTTRLNSEMGVSGYRLDAVSVVKYVNPPR